MKFLSRSSNNEAVPAPNTLIGVGSSLRGTLMVSGTLRIEGDVEGDILNCERLEIGEHGMMRADIEVREAVIQGRVYGNVRAHGLLELKNGARVEGDIAAEGVVMEPGVYFTGRCTMLDTGANGPSLAPELVRTR